MTPWDGSRKPRQSGDSEGQGQSCEVETRGKETQAALGLQGEPYFKVSCLVLLQPVGPMVILRHAAPGDLFET